MSCKKELNWTCESPARVPWCIGNLSCCVAGIFTALVKRQSDHERIATTGLLFALYNVKRLKFIKRIQPMKFGNYLFGVSEILEKNR